MKRPAETGCRSSIYASRLKVGPSRKQLLTNILATAREQGVVKPTIYRHSIDYFLHEPQLAIGTVKEDVCVPARGDVVLVDHSCFTAELTVAVPIHHGAGADCGHRRR